MPESRAVVCGDSNAVIGRTAPVHAISRGFQEGGAVERAAYLEAHQVATVRQSDHIGHAGAISLGVAGDDLDRRAPSHAIAGLGQFEHLRMAGFGFVGIEADQFSILADSEFRLPQAAAVARF